MVPKKRAREQPNVSTVTMRAGVREQNKEKSGRTLGSSSDPVSPRSSLVLHPSCGNSVWWVPVEHYGRIIGRVGWHEPRPVPVIRSCFSSLWFQPWRVRYRVLPMKDPLGEEYLERQKWMVVSRSLTHPPSLGWQGNPHITPIGTARNFPRRPPTGANFALLSQFSSPRGYTRSRTPLRSHRPLCL